MAQSIANGMSPLVVLVVEDEFLIRDAIVEYLRDCGCVVFEACSADQAVTLSRNGSVDVLVTDIDLNGSASGWDVAEQLRAEQPEIGVVYVSGKVADHSRLVSRSLFYSKPYRDADILQACHQVGNAPSHNEKMLGRRAKYRFSTNRG